MIQETFDCLLIRACFINNTEDELLDSIDSKDTFISLIKKVSDLMQNEDFFLLKDEYQEKLSRIIQKYRFQYNDSSINEDINYIILRLNKYKAMSNERKKYLINKFYQDQYAIRNMPKAYQVPVNIDKFMQLDFSVLIQLFPENNDDNTDVDLEILNVTEFISLMNILLNKHSEIFMIDGFVENTINNLKELLDTQKLRLYDLMYIKNTIKNFKKFARGKYKVITI